MDEGKYEITIYTSCCNATKVGSITIQIYDNHQISAVDLHEEDLDADELSRYPMITECEIHWQNKN